MGLNAVRRHLKDTITNTYVRRALVLVVASALLMALDASHFNGIDDETVWERFCNRMYLLLTTISTVGYGDIHPKSVTARAVLGVVMACMIVEFDPLRLFETLVQGQVTASKRLSIS